MIEARLRLPRAGFTLDVELQLPTPGVSVLFGPSGCGKTSVLRALAGLDRAAGWVRVDGQSWQDDAQRRWLPTHRRGLGYVTQDAALFAHLSVRGNLDYGRQRAGAEMAALQAAVALLGLQPLLERRPQALSGGERQRVAIARALAAAPRLLLLDEPLAALDAARKADVLPYLERLAAARALPVVYVTHALDEVAQLAQHLVLMDDGRVVDAGPVGTLFARADGPLAQRDDAGSVFDAQVDGHDRDHGLTRLALPGGARLWLGQVDAPPGSALRVRVLARDVSVSRHMPRLTSVLNLLPARLHSLSADRGNTVLLRLALCGDGQSVAPGLECASAPGAAANSEGGWLLSRITRKSADALALAPGDALVAQVKGVALMRQPAPR